MYEFKGKNNRIIGYLQFSSKKEFRLYSQYLVNYYVKGYNEGVKKGISEYGLNYKSWNLSYPKIKTISGNKKIWTK